MKLNAIQRSIQRSSAELLILAKQFLKHKPTSRQHFRQMLQHPETQIISNHHPTSKNHSTTHFYGHDENRIALNLLKVDKEFHLIQYHGLQKYLSNHVSSWYSTKSAHLMTYSSSASKSADSSSTPTPNSKSSTITPIKKAKVAFMITAQQRRVLMTEYNYTQQEIKSMKPNEAQIILENSIHASVNSHSSSENEYGWKSVVKEIIQKELQEEEQKMKEAQAQKKAMGEKKMEKGEEYKEEREYDHHQEQQQKQKQQLSNDILSIGFEEPLSQDQSAQNQMKTKEECMDSKQTTILLLQDNIKSSSTITRNQEEENEENKPDSNDIWYEVIESSSLTAPSDQPIALYRSLEEAEEFLMIKKDLAEKRKNDSASGSIKDQFFIRERKI